MALLGFQDRFIRDIERGFKTHTIRGTREIPIRVGEWLHLYGRPRQKGMHLIFRAPCVRIEQIHIDETFEMEPRLAKEMLIPPSLTMAPQIWISSDFDAKLEWKDGMVSAGDTVRLSWHERQRLAVRDGFKGGFPEMMKFWKGRLPFTGQIIHWNFEKRTMEKIDGNGKSSNQLRCGEREATRTRRADARRARG